MKCKVLVVDDSSLARRLTRKILEDLGHEVEEAADGPQVLERHALNQHDLVVLDLVMHGMDGLQVLQKFRELNPNAVVIVSTADIQRSTRDQVKEAGAAAMLNKPLNKETFAETLTLVLAGGDPWN